MIQPDELMHLAIGKAREGIGAGQTPFGCAIAGRGGIVAVEHNTVLATTDITAHAEVNAIRQACRVRGGIELADCIVASTCEPCPMCIAALHWARVSVVYCGATIEDAQAAGFNELRIPADEVLAIGGSPVKLMRGILDGPCRALFREWLARPGRRAY